MKIMLDPVPTSAAEPAALLPANLASVVQAYQRASKAGSTVKAYRGDAVLFEAWCSQYGFRSLLASPEAVAGFLSHEAEAGRASSTIGRRLAAIRYVHKLARLEPSETLVKLLAARVAAMAPRLA